MSRQSSSSRMRVWLVSAGLALGSAVSGCGVHALQRGEDLYASGDYIGAAEVFEHTEKSLPEWSPAERTRYSLYRSATAWSLGDRPAAERWALRANELLRREPAALSASETAMLQQLQAGFGTVDGQGESASARADLVATSPR